MRTQHPNCSKGYRILQRLADLTLAIVCAAGLILAVVFACLWL